ncbi:ribonuclease HII [Clostridia bacterium]|nr:ribonuclease HII [Clostridia bacterium]
MWMEELFRLEKMKQFEFSYSSFNFICGVDEVGRGALAGPVVACAVILKKPWDIHEIKDSKQLSAFKREKLAEKIKKESLAYAISAVSPKDIDQINILQATYQAMKKAVEKLSFTPQMVLVDALDIPKLLLPQKAIIKGDEKSVSIAAASIVAKVYRDHLMKQYDGIYPHYHFAAHKGYGTSDHIQQIKKYGISIIHRKTS